MRMKAVLALQPEDTVMHTRYGLSKIREVKLDLSGGLFGIVIHPETIEGQKLLALDSQTMIQDFMEDSIRRLKPVQVDDVEETTHKQSS